MDCVTIKPAKLQGEIAVPPSKSHSMRAILFASLAAGESHIENSLASPDVEAMIAACQAFGAKITQQADTLTIVGVAGKPNFSETLIDAGNSGQVLRFVAAIAALTDQKITFTGDHSIKTSRPIKPLTEGLSGFGVVCDGECAPFSVQGPVHAGTAHLNGADSQPVSALLMVAALGAGPFDIYVENPGETPWILLTLDWFDRLGIAYERNGFSHYRLPGGVQLNAFDYVVPGDFSSAAFPIVAALVTQSEITVHNLNPNDVQGDKGVLDVLTSMGAEFVWQGCSLQVKRCERLQAKTVDVNHFVDAVPILAVMACFAEGETVLTGAGIARQKESNRLAAMTVELSKMGADIVETSDGLCIRPAVLHNAGNLQSYHDHRIAMALAVASLGACGESVIHEIKCVSKSFPGFFEALAQLGSVSQAG